MIVEDDLIARQIIAAELRREGFEVLEAESLASAQLMFQHHPADLVVADVNLPDGLGFDLIKSLRTKRDLAVIYTTTRGGSADRIHGLETGGDDYVVKPVDAAELRARVNAVLRRYRRNLPQPPQNPVLSLAGWTVDLVRRELADPLGQVVDLTRGEFDLFAALVQTQAVLDRDYLTEVISSAQANPSPRTIDVLISRIRRKFADLSVPAPRIVTVVGQGYAIEPPQA